MKGRPIIIEYEGEPRSLAEIGGMIGVPSRTLTWRYAAGKRGEDLFAPVDESRKLLPERVQRAAAGGEDRFLARLLLGSERPSVVRVVGDSVRMSDYHKRRARVVPRESRAWWFDAKRTALGEQLCPPGAAAIGRTPTEAIAAAMSLMSLYQQAMIKR